MRATMTADRSGYLHCEPPTHQDDRHPVLGHIVAALICAAIWFAVGCLLALSF